MSDQGRTPPLLAAEEHLRDLLVERRPSRLADLEALSPPAPAPGLLPAAVLLLLERVPGYAVVLTKRTQSVDLHKGEVSFAGGMADPQDTDACATALREAEEELGIRPRDVSVLGVFDAMVTVTGFVVTPVVGAVGAGYPYRPNPAEVERVLSVPLLHLRDAAHWYDEERQWRGRTYRLRSCRFGDDVIWGATSRLLQRFLELVPPGLLENAT